MSATIRGDRLSRMREDRKLTYDELSKRTGLSPAALHRYEKQRTDPNGHVLSVLAEYFNVSVDFLLGRTDDPSPPGLKKLTPDEVAVINLWRKGEKLEAIDRIIHSANDKAAVVG